MQTVDVVEYTHPLVIILSLGVLVACFVMSIQGSRDPVLLITPYDCQQPDLYANASTWYLSSWALLYGRGACPVGTRGDFTAYYHRGTQVTSEAYYGYGYSNCINNATQWEQLDVANAENGYRSNLAGDEGRWTFSLICIVGSVIVLFFAGFLLLLTLSEAMGGGSGVVSLYGMLLAIFLVFLFFAQQLAVVVLMPHYRRADAKAWSTAFFESCSVDVQIASGYWFSLICTALSGAVLLVVGMAVVWHTQRSPNRLPSLMQPARRRRDGYKELSGDITGRF